MAFKILSPCGILGYGYPIESFERGLSYNPDAIVVDAGSTDAGPHKLGAGVAIVSRNAYKKDLVPMLRAGADRKIPVLVGSAGGAGGRVHLEWSISVVREILEEYSLTHLKVAIIPADISKERILECLDRGEVEPLGLAVPPLTREALEATNAVVAQMGHEPILAALSAGADVILCGRAYDPAPFAAVAMHRGYDPGLCYHMGKILECAALCAEPGTTKDCMLGVLEGSYFDIVPLSDSRRCTKTSVAAHTFYEKTHPFLLKGPGGMLDLSGCTFTENGDGSVRVQGSRFVPDAVYKIKLEGARMVGYRSFVIAGVRDPLLLEKLPEVEALVKEQVQRYFSEIPEDSYQIQFINYGLDGVMGESEPVKAIPHEVGVLFEVIAESQSLANDILSNLRSTFLHYGYPGRKSTAGNLAFPFAPSDVPFGPVYAFSVYHLIPISDPCSCFPLEWLEGSGRK